MRLGVLQLGDRSLHPHASTPPPAPELSLQLAGRDVGPKLVARLNLVEGTGHARSHTPRALALPLHLDLCRLGRALLKLSQRLTAPPCEGEEEHLLRSLYEVEGAVLRDAAGQRPRPLHADLGQIHAEAEVAPGHGSHLLPKGRAQELHGLAERQPHLVVLVQTLPAATTGFDHVQLSATFPLLIALKDHGDHEIHDHKRDKEREAHPVDDRQDVQPERGRDAAVRLVDEALGLQNVPVTLRIEEIRGRAPVSTAEPVRLAPPEVMHDLVPGLPRLSAVERHEGPAEVAEVPVRVESLARFHGGEEAHAKHRVEHKDQQQDRTHARQLPE
mmetsp:Transcript_22446/g.66840  ORF Transcript_22446/g.66840 Transcript_22446/m.66840 type:complete len:330 (-) Transcript_22446:190-1179(-)